MFSFIFAVLSTSLFWVWLGLFIPNAVATIYATDYKRSTVRVTRNRMAVLVAAIFAVGKATESLNCNAYAVVFAIFLPLAAFLPGFRDLLCEYYGIVMDLPTRVILNDLIAAKQAFRPAIWSYYERVYNILPVPDKYLDTTQGGSNVTDTLPSPPQEDSAQQSQHHYTVDLAPYNTQVSNRQAEIGVLQQEKEDLAFEKMNLEDELRTARIAHRYRERELMDELEEAKRHTCEVDPQAYKDKLDQLEKLEEAGLAKDKAIAEKNAMIEKLEQESLQKDQFIAKIIAALNKHNGVMDNIAEFLNLSDGSDVVTGLRIFVQSKDDQIKRLIVAVDERDAYIKSIMSQGESQFTAMAADFQQKESSLQADIERLSSQHETEVSGLETKLEAANKKVGHFDKLMSHVKALLSPNAHMDFRSATVHCLNALLKHGATADDLGFDAACMAELDRLFQEIVDSPCSPFRKDSQITPPAPQQPASFLPPPQQQRSEPFFRLPVPATRPLQEAVPLSSAT